MDDAWQMHIEPLLSARSREMLRLTCTHFYYMFEPIKLELESIPRFDVEDFARYSWRFGNNLMSLTEYAAYYGRLDYLKYLETNYKDSSSWYNDKGSGFVAKWAAAGGHLDCLQYLLGELKTRIDSEGLVLAAEHGDINVLKYIVKQRCPTYRIRRAIQKAKNDEVRNYLTEL